MGIQCLKCGEIIEGNGGLHIGLTCNKCHNEDIDQFVRVEDTEINEEQSDRMLKWLESIKQA